MFLRIVSQQKCSCVYIKSSLLFFLIGWRGEAHWISLFSSPRNANLYKESLSWVLRSSEKDHSCVSTHARTAPVTVAIGLSATTSFVTCCDSWFSFRIALLQSSVLYSRIVTGFYFSLNVLLLVALNCYSNGITLLQSVCQHQK